MSTVLIFGAFAVGPLGQKEADAAMESVLAHGINHIDVAPSYADAELRLGPWLKEHRERFFLGCKTELRGREEAREELHRSLERLQIEAFDLYQLHNVSTMETLEQCLAPGGSMEAVLEAREQGLTTYVGITSHGWQAPAVQMEALRRFDFDTVLFPLSFVMWADADYRRDATALLQLAAERDVGTMAIKTLARRLWGGREPLYHTWYEPFDDADIVERALSFTLSQPVTGAISTGDARLLPMLLEAAERFEPMPEAEQQALLATAGEHESIF
jgi:aryl-alcohol dehydrogenase-like predicted oxidoreductase